MENDYRITKLHGTLIGDNRIPDLPVGEKTKVFSSTNGKTAWVDLPEGGKELELIEVSNATINHDGSYTYTLPNKPTSNPYILKTVDSGESAYYLMTGDSDVSFGMRPIALADSLFGGNFMVVSGTTATQRPTYFPPQPKSADNGKVLTVNNGYPSWETAGGAIPVVEVTLNGDSSITLPEAQTTNFIIHSEEFGYIYVNNVDGIYSAIIPVGKDNSGNNQLALFSGEGTNLTLEVVPLGGGTSSGVIKSFPFPQTINSEKGYNLLYPIIDAGEIVYAGNAVTDNNLGNFRLMLGLSSNVVPTAEGEQEYCNFDCIVKDMGIGRMSLKKDANNIPQFKSFTTWLPPVTSADEGKYLVVKNGNGQWATIDTSNCGKLDGEYDWLSSNVFRGVTTLYSPTIVGGISSDGGGDQILIDQDLSEEFGSLFKRVTGFVSTYQTSTSFAFEALGFINENAFGDLSKASVLSFVSTTGKSQWIEPSTNTKYNYQLPKKSGTIALTSDLSEAGTSVTIRRW